MPRVFLIIIALTIPVLVFSQLDKDRAFRLIEKRGEAYFSMPLKEVKKSYYPGALPNFDRITNDSVYIYLSEKDSSFILANAEFLELLPPPSMLRRVKMTDDREEVLNGKAYPTYSLYLEIMEYFRDTYPDMCTIDTIGKSLQERYLLAARLTAAEDRAVPVVFFSSSIHGDEVAGYVFMLMLIDHLLSSNDPAINELLNYMVVVIHPLENPDGTYFSSDTSVFGATRGNANGIDLNRNYPDPEDGDHPDGNEWQPETLAMMNYLEKIRPSISANFHGGAELVNYPFDTWSFRHADDDWFRFISREYANLAQSKIPGYLDDFGGVINGFEWYEVNGGRQDFTTYFLRGRETTIELSRRKFLPEDELVEYWEANRESMTAYLRQGLFGIHGIVRDSVNNDFLSAEVRVRNHDRLNSSVFSNSSNGRFFRYIKEGFYDLDIFAQGFRQGRIEDVEVNDYKVTNLNINLLPLDYVPESDIIRLGPNPFRTEFTLYLDLSKDSDIFFSIYDLMGRRIQYSYKQFPAGYHEHVVQPNIEPGTYLLKLDVNGRVMEFRVMGIE